MVTKSGRYGGTFADSDIALEFASWIPLEFKLYLIQDYKKLKNDETSKFSLGWNLNRELSKINYTIQTDAIKNSLISRLLTEQEKLYAYATEADILNVALFNTIAKQWCENNKSTSGNIRDNATLNQLLVLSNLESYNAILINTNVDMSQRITQLNLFTYNGTLNDIINTSIPEIMKPSLNKNCLNRIFNQ